jgi:hypothetical protein
VVPLAGHDARLGRPVLPEELGCGERLVRVDRVGRHEVRRRIGQREGHGLAGGDDEVALDTIVRHAHRCGAAQHHLIGAGDDAQRVVFLPVDPWDARTVAEADSELHVHGDAAALAHDHAHKVGMAAARRHEVDHLRYTLVGLEPRLEDQRVALVLPRHAAAGAERRQGPCSGAPSRAAKQASESKRGQHIHSTEPSRATRATVSQSPISA